MRPPLTPVEKQRRVLLRLLEKKRSVAAAPAPKRTNAPGRPPRAKTSVLAMLDEKIAGELALLHALQQAAGMPLTPLSSIRIVRKDPDAPRPGRPALLASTKLKNKLETLKGKLEALMAAPDAAFAVIHAGAGRPLLSRKQRMTDLQQQIAILKRQYREAKTAEDLELREQMEKAREAAIALADAAQQKQELENRISALTQQTRKAKAFASLK